MPDVADGMVVGTGDVGSVLVELVGSVLSVLVEQHAPPVHGVHSIHVEGLDPNEHADDNIEDRVLLGSGA